MLQNIFLENYEFEAYNLYILHLIYIYLIIYVWGNDTPMNIPKSSRIHIKSALIFLLINTMSILSICTNSVYWGPVLGPVTSVGLHIGCYTLLQTLHDPHTD